MNAIVQWFEHSLVLPFLWNGMRIDLFQYCGHCWVFQICWHIECNTLMASFFRVLNSSTGIPSYPPALLTALLPYPFICWWASRLLPCPGYYKQCCNEHWGTCVSFRSGFLGVYAQEWDFWVIWHGMERDVGGGSGWGNTCKSTAD